MPIFEYRCKECGHSFETLLSASQADRVQCPQCQGPVLRLVSLFSAPSRGQGSASSVFSGGCCGGSCGCGARR